MTRTRTLYNIFLLVFASTIMSNHLNAMERPASTVAQMICKACSCYYYLDSFCVHNLCPNCLFDSFQGSEYLSSIYSTLSEFECQRCKKWVIIGTERKFKEEPDANLLEELHAGLGNAKNLLCALEFVNTKSSQQKTIDLLQQALMNRGRSLCNIKGNDENTILHYACRDGAPLEVIIIILQAAGSDASTLVCTENFWGQTALYFAVRAIKDYRENSFNKINILLNAAPGKEWDLINKKTLRHFTDRDHSVLSYAESNGEKNNGYTKELIKLLKKYEPKGEG